MTSPLRTRWDRGVTAGLALVACAAVTYALIHDRAERPLAIFLFGPLVAAVLSDTRRAAIVSGVAVVVATAEGVALGLDGSALWVRLVILGAGSALALAGSATRARQQAQFEEVRVRLALADTFQTGLVPAPNPGLGVTVTTRYRPGERGLLLGGDFLDVTTLPDGATAFVIGDVSGHGARAAAFGTAVRAGWKGIAHARPDALQTWLDDTEAAFFGDRRYDGFVTAIAGRVDPSDGEIALVSAGHPWPLRLAPDVRQIEVAPGRPLGIGGGAARRITRSRIAPGEPWLFYTDGLTENAWTPGGRADEAGLLRTVAGLADRSDLDELLGKLGPQGFQDDVALLLLGVEPARG